MAKFYKWDLDKVSIYPFGGVVKFNEMINKPIYEEILILINGPLFQLIYFLFVYILYSKGYITFRNYNLFKTYNLTLLSFNLLLIYPLDGGRIFNLILNKYLPYKKSNYIMIFISCLLILVLFVFYKSFNFYLMGILLICEVFSYLKRQNFLYNRLLLERYMYDIRHKDIKVINNKDKMFKNKRHVLFYKNKYITEKDYLKERFNVR